MNTSPHQKSLSDEKLFLLCKKFGEQTRVWRQKFIGLLPEVYKRRLYEKKGFSSIFEFAAKLAGLSADQVRLTLNLEKKFANRPMLQQLLVNGEISINKLVRVASIATPENEGELAEKIKLLPQKAIEVLVRDEKISARTTFGAQNENGFQKPLFAAKSLRAQTLNFELSEEVIKQLNELHENGISIDELLHTFLREREDNIAMKKNEISQQSNSSPEQAVSRYIPVRIKRILKEEYGDKCSISSCKNLSENIHHTQRFGLMSSHDPHYLAPLCKQHHQIAHSIDVKYHEVRTGLK